LFSEVTLQFDTPLPETPYPAYRTGIQTAQHIHINDKTLRV